MDIKRLQQQAALAVDELLSISEDISQYVTAAYGNVPQDIFDIQCRFHLTRCQRLEGKLYGFLAELADAVQERDGLTGEGQDGSVVVTRQMIEQNLLVLHQKQELLKGLLEHSGRTQSCLDASGELRDRAEMIRLQNILRGELRKCRTENGK